MHGRAAAPRDASLAVSASLIGADQDDWRSEASATTPADLFGVYLSTVHHAVERDANGMEPLSALLSPAGIPVHAPDHQRCPAVLPRAHHGHPAP